MDIEQILKDNLTQEQYKAAMDNAKEVLCLACAGSGKSRTLAYRIARLLAEGEPPGGIVAFTFTDKAAESIKRRVSQALVAAGIDPTVIGAMYIGTIHAYCQHVLGEMDATYRQYDVLDENRLKLYLISRSSALGLYQFRSRARNNSYFDIIEQVSDAWKTANDEILNFNTVANEDSELADLLNRIKDKLRTDQYIDFSLMIRDAVDAIDSNSASVKNGIGKLRHLMVDEYQDVNPCQEKLISLLHQRAETLFVVGDDDQSIYAWRGADVSNILSFAKRYTSCSIHTLSKNFRSTEPIVQASNSFVASMLGPSRINKNPQANKNQTPQDFRVLSFPDRVAEAKWVAERIKALRGTAYNDDGNLRGLTPADFAILMRSTRQAEQDESPRHEAFTTALEKLGIPFSLEAGGGPFDRPQTSVLRTTFELLREPGVNRDTVQQHFENEVLSAYPSADFDALVRVLTDWSRRIHCPKGAPRIRLYPQKLVYDLLESFNVALSNFKDEVMRDIGLFSQMIMDVETVYMSVDSSKRFAEVLNFLQNVAEKGYNVSTDDVLQRPDAVTVSTVHKMKGLEFPCVFVVDTEARRFPKKKSKYTGWLPHKVMAAAIDRGAYQSTHDEESRLFYTAVTRAERYLYVSCAEKLPMGKQNHKLSPYALKLAEHPKVLWDSTGLPVGLASFAPRRRVEEADYPTSFTEIKSYLHCPKEYQFRERYGFNPIIPEMFGYGRTVHTSIEKTHELYPGSPPDADQVESVVLDTFHLKHVPESGDPKNHPGPYEHSRNRAMKITQNYVASFGNDFERERQVEAIFEIPASNCVLTGSIDLLLHKDENGDILQAEVIDFKTIEGGENPTENKDIDWTELALQVQLYARAADQVLGHNAKTGSVHLLKDNQRVEVPITKEAVDSALANVEWAVTGILASDFPMRPHQNKCSKCDFQTICPKIPQEFHVLTTAPPELHLPERNEMVRAFSLYKA
ncbi:MULTISPECIES: ATP-dependent helicase [Dethiosulfovibrio]|uniref:DNA 3'-5' helicase n=2 Tax=Dethiosulfovibrio TaxID=47054 RepID=A0ABS9EKX9_9BACT|nr:MULTISPECIES: ATP-dependent DNA helicase [Dethiosulfovibrio]MCF4113724.1 ATP-dependent helicase [Dethiosulfovibrio russensis]MCF4141863.1 ATP-dependent helicase [Dethiosulfovibrio marinus]MCF4143719.1 ATP-dependent helicase [Dethiosulfovibrio acidaminovorans]